MPPFSLERFYDGYRFQIVSDDQQKSYWVICSNDFLDDEVGDDRTQESSIFWIQNHLDDLMSAWSDWLQNRSPDEPFNRVLIQEIR